MNRLQSELQRLYLPRSPAGADADLSSSTLIDAEDRVRALVMELRQPASWDTLATVWRGVQTELELPAPVIAVSGVAGLQLWFSLAEPVSVSRGHAFLESLRSRFLAEIAPRKICLMPAPSASSGRQDLHTRIVPARQEPTGNWSAFVAPDLAPVFADTPWLDIPPSVEGQAALLRGLESIKPAEFEAVSKRLGEGGQPTGGMAVPTIVDDDALALNTPVDTVLATRDPKRFLLQVMNDVSVAMALRIEAAKALLAFSGDRLPKQDD